MSKEEMAGVGDGGMKHEDNERVVSCRIVKTQNKAARTTSTSTKTDRGAHVHPTHASSPHPRRSSSLSLLYAHGPAQRSNRFRLSQLELECFMPRRRQAARARS